MEDDKGVIGTLAEEERDRQLVMNARIAEAAPYGIPHAIGTDCGISTLQVPEAAFCELAEAVARRRDPGKRR